MKLQVLRSPIHTNLSKLTARERREQWKITTNIPKQRQQEIDKYLRNSERGFLSMSHDGAEITRQITASQVAKFLECKDCNNKPVVSFSYKKRCVGVCAHHWTTLAPTVIGWNGE